jgi:hypothetical protein
MVTGTGVLVSIMLIVLIDVTSAAGAAWAMPSRFRRTVAALTRSRCCCGRCAPQQRRRGEHALGEQAAAVWAGREVVRLGNGAALLKIGAAFGTMVGIERHEIFQTDDLNDTKYHLHDITI